MVGSSGRFSCQAPRWAAVPAVAVLLVGCAAAPSGQPPGSSGSARQAPRDGVGRAAPPSGGDPQAALATWRSFPIQATPRPLVLTAGNVLDPPTGFVTGDQKVAYIGGQFTLATALPAAPSTSGGYPIVTAKAALDRLRANFSHEKAVSPLRIVNAVLGKATFGTDRGPEALPAWRFTLDGVAGAVQVLAIAPTALWPAKPLPIGSQEQASIAADGQTVTYNFYGSPPGPSPCGAEYAGRVTESRTAAVISVQVDMPNPAGSNGAADQACAAIAALRTVTVRLAAPRGGRVLLTAQGTPISVTGG
ncbi:MAG: hypothetical protein QOI26_1758 [Pseudonocardiales bacterium]|nr:hypothetical protein [Pseudonocardiales bacterium]